MANGPLPIGSLHVRDFDDFRQQRTLADLAPDDKGYVRLACLHCPRTGKVRLADLHERFAMNEGLVNILNTLLPRDCAKAERNPWGNRACGFCYRDLA